MLKQFYLWLSKPLLLHWLPPYLMGLVVFGTIAQKYMGLYDSQRLFFSSFFFWVGLLPLPGGWTVSALLLISLSAKLILASPWHKHSSGIFIAHLGIMLLLVGGLVTAIFSVEGFIALAPNESAENFSDYHSRQFTISKNNVAVKTIPLTSLWKKRVVQDATLPFTVTINDLCNNCTMQMRTSTTGIFHGPAQKVKLSLVPSYLEDERDLSGIEFTVAGAGAPADGSYIAFEPMDKQPSFTIGKDTYTISLGRKHYPLPFTLQLIEAHKELHPGTEIARSYYSTVLLTDGPIQQRALISMNHPLRYKGYTVYESSFNGEEQQTKSVSFAVVRNSGRVFPYVASATLCIGLLIHLTMRLPALIRKNTLKKDAHAL